MPKQNRSLIEGNPVLVVIDIQGGNINIEDVERGDTRLDDPSSIPLMPDYDKRVAKAPRLIEKARACNVPIVFFQEAHRPDLVDFGRELDGAEGIHLLEGDPRTEIASFVGMQPDDYFIRKRRYSCFFGTEFEILLKGLKANTLILIGGHTDVCVHYSFVDAHQHDYFCRVVEDCVAGSSLAAHEAALNAMEYLQTGARCYVTEVLEAFEQFSLRA